MSNGLGREPIVPTQVHSDGGAEYIVRFCCKPWSLLHLRGRMEEGERAGDKLVRVSFQKHEVGTLWGAVYTRLLITHATVSRHSCSGGATRQSGKSPAQPKQANKQSRRSEDVQMQPNYFYLYLLPKHSSCRSVPLCDKR